MSPRSTSALLLLLILPFAARRASATDDPSTHAPLRGVVHVAFAVTAGANVIDLAGPWEVFQDATVPEPGARMDEQSPFRLYTVSDKREPVAMTGGLRVMPDYTFDDAPIPDIVVIGAQRGSDAMLTWLRRVSEHATVMSVCTGAFKLAKAGLLDGKAATTHHDFYDSFASSFPRVRLERGRRWVEASPTVFTAGGLTSGIDLALHLVATLYGDAAAGRTAAYMEHGGNGWKDPAATTVAAVATGPDNASMIRADHYLPNLELGDDVQVRNLQSDGGVDHWKAEILITSSLATDQLFRRLGRQLEDGGRWKLETAISTVDRVTRGSWTFRDERGRLWRGEMRLEPSTATTDRKLVLEIRLAG